MSKRTITKWLSEFDLTTHGNGDFTKEEIATILTRFAMSGATYVNIDGGECTFYKETEETDEEYNHRLKSEEDAKITVEKYEFEKAKQTYLKLKEKYDN
jgi:hypothetical protein